MYNLRNRNRGKMHIINSLNNNNKTLEKEIYVWQKILPLIEYCLEKGNHINITEKVKKIKSSMPDFEKQRLEKEKEKKEKEKKEKEKEKEKRERTITKWFNMFVDNEDVFWKDIQTYFRFDDKDTMSPSIVRSMINRRSVALIISIKKYIDYVLLSPSMEILKNKLYLKKNDEVLLNIVYHIIFKGKDFYKAFIDQPEIILYLLESNVYHNMYDNINDLHLPQ